MYHRFTSWACSLEFPGPPWSSRSLICLSNFIKDNRLFCSNSFIIFPQCTPSTSFEFFRSDFYICWRLLSAVKYHYRYPVAWLAQSQEGTFENWYPSLRRVMDLRMSPRDFYSPKDQFELLYYTYIRHWAGSGSVGQASTIKVSLPKHAHEVE